MARGGYWVGKCNRLLASQHMLCLVTALLIAMVQVSQDGRVTCELVAGAVPGGEKERTQSGPTRVSDKMMHVS